MLRECPKRSKEVWWPLTVEVGTILMVSHAQSTLVEKREATPYFPAYKPRLFDPDFPYCTLKMAKNSTTPTQTCIRPISVLEGL